MKNKFRGILVCLMVTTLVLGGITQIQVQASDKVDYSAVFDADYYYNTYADLRSAIGNDREKLLQHFITFGMQEGRRGNADFDVKIYMGNYQDLIQTFGLNDLKSYYFHYIYYGKKEGRNAVSANTNASATVPSQSLISSYTTAYDASQSRAVNIALAASKINGTLIKPGQQFSFSDTVGPRTVENGFIEAPSFLNGKVISDIGGGICQVSSTTYAAMLQGGIKATQRHAHSMPVSYIPEGMDATIVAGQKDLTFTNNFNFLIVINASINNGTVTVSFSKR
ncbi:MAG: VanW family protein [Lachnospiraceae bacterium]|nr:VanW family protein [Lachnospiraceae bacterium]